jgi:hypothetical protein
MIGNVCNDGIEKTVVILKNTNVNLYYKCTNVDSWSVVSNHTKDGRTGKSYFTPDISFHDILQIMILSLILLLYYLVPIDSCVSASYH